MLKVSIVIPAFNQEAYVGQAVESALAQTYSPVDVVVVDDGSTDATAAALRRFETRRDVTVIHQSNAGLPAARNRGLEAAQGDLVTFLDADDFLASAYVERLAHALASDPETSIAYCDIQMVDAFGAPSNPFSVAASRSVLSGDIFESLLVGGYFPPHAVMVRRQALQDLGEFDLELGGHADYELWLRLSGRGCRAQFIDERLAFYRISANSMSRDLDHMRATRILALEKIAKAMPARFAAGLSRIQEAAVDLHAANQWLQHRWHDVMRKIEGGGAGAWSLQAHFPDARLVAGGVNQLALWDTTMHDSFERAVFLHPPAALEIVIPTGAAGRLSTAFAIHPDAWTKPDAGACVFSIDIDRSVAATAILNPRERMSDRRWVAATVDVPAAADGRHVLRLETQSLGSSHFAWALFRDVTFTEHVQSS